MTPRPSLPPLAALLQATAGLALAGLLCSLAAAATPAKPGAAPAAKAPPKAAAKPAPKAPAKAAPRVAAEPPLPEATALQIEAAAMVLYGRYDCDFGQTVDVVTDAKHPGYVSVRLAKQTWVMKPVLSSTGALRIEDVKARMLLLQIANKSMLMDVIAGRRLVDECVHETQRQTMAARAAAEAAAAVSDAASAAAQAPATAAMPTTSGPVPGRIGAPMPFTPAPAASARPATPGATPRL